MSGRDDGLEPLVAAIVERFGLDPAVRAPLVAVCRAVAEDEHAPTAVRDPEGVVERHVADSLSALALAEVRGARHAADLGSGAGFPGLALAAALPDCAWTLVESVARKARFIADTATAAGLTQVSVAPERVEEWTDGLGRCDLVTARALAPLPVLVEYAAPLLAPGGAVVCWKGAPEDAEIATGDRAAAELGLGPAVAHVLPATAGADRRSLYVYSKVGETPSRFPRRAGMARKRPLGGSTRG